MKALKRMFASILAVVMVAACVPASLATDTSSVVAQLTTSAVDSPVIGKKISTKITASNKSVKASSRTQTVKLSVKVKGSNKISYSSSNRKIKVSSKGVVTIPGKFAGTVTITIKASETTIYKAASKKITVKVYKIAASRPSKVKSLKARAASRSKIKLSWKKASHASYYEIHVWRGSKLIKKITVSGNSKTISGLRRHTKYYFHVRAVHKGNSYQYATHSSSWSKLRGGGYTSR